jgi:hypothetical protein
MPAKRLPAGLPMSGYRRIIPGALSAAGNHHKSGMNFTQLALKTGLINSDLIKNARLSEEDIKKVGRTVEQNVLNEQELWLANYGKLNSF